MEVITVPIMDELTTETLIQLRWDIETRLAQNSINLNSLGDKRQTVYWRLLRACLSELFAEFNEIGACESR